MDITLTVHFFIFATVPGFSIKKLLLILTCTDSEYLKVRPRLVIPAEDIELVVSD